MNKKLSTQPYKGARDIYPKDMRVQNYIFQTLKKVCLSYGYKEYAFPILEPLEIFAAKTGEEIVNNQLFTVTDQAGRKLAIRPELTPGTVRMLAQKYKELVKPIRWFMIGNNYRYEKPQKGRGREFNQLEVNIFGVENVTADYEIFTIIIDIMRAFGANENQFEILYSDRRLILALLTETLSLDEKTANKVRRIMDKRAKMTKENFYNALNDLGLNRSDIDIIEQFMSSNIQNLKNVIPEKILNKNLGYKNIVKLTSLLNTTGLLKYCRFEPSIIRGFDYSDGLVYEVFDKNPKNNRSLFGGERFDKLINIFGNYNLPATGFAMGDITLLEFLKSWDLLPGFENQTGYLVTLWPAKTEKEKQIYLQASLRAAKKLREKGLNVETFLTPNTDLTKQLKFANKKGIKNVVIIGETELKSASVTIRNMQTGEQTNNPLDQI